MKNVIEVVFEDISDSTAMQLLSFLILSSEKIISFHCSENIEILESGNISKEDQAKIIEFDGSLSVLLYAQRMNINELFLPMVQLRLVKYGNQYDVDFNFDSGEIEGINLKRLIKELHSFAKRMAKMYSIASFFSGMEPASDEDTRYFTNEHIGPIIPKS